MTFCAYTLISLLLFRKLSSRRSLSVLSSPLVFLSCVLPLLVPLHVATSRITDKWHHPSDVLCGSCIGVLAAVAGFSFAYGGGGGGKIKGEDGGGDKEGRRKVGGGETEPLL